MKREQINEIRLLSPKNKERFLQIIEKLEELAEMTPKKQPITFSPAVYLGSDGYDEQRIIEKLQEWEILSFDQEELESGLLIFTTLEKLREVKSILSGYSSGVLDYVTREGMEEFLEDEKQLINKLLQIGNKQTKSVTLMYPALLATNNPDTAGFNKNETVNVLFKEKKVFRNLEPLPNSSNHTQIIKAEIDFDKLNKRAEELHDSIEGRGNDVLGSEQQKRNLLELLQNRFNKYPNQPTYTYSEKILGAYQPKNDTRPLGYSLLQPDSNRPEIRYRFMETMRALEKNGYITIENVEIDFEAQPQPTEESLNNHKWSLGERSLKFYPAEHCEVTLRPKKQKEQIIEPSHSKKGKPKYEIRDRVGYVIFEDKESNPFKKLEGRQWKLVKQLVGSFGLAVTDETTFKNIRISQDTKRYPEIINDSYSGGSKIHQIIENTIAEIQRNFAGSSLGGLFSIHHEGKKVWMNFLQ